MKSFHKYLLLDVVFTFLLACGYPQNQNNESKNTPITKDDAIARTDTFTPTDSITNVSPTSENKSERIPGVWTGISQWNCDENPVWQTTITFYENGSATAMFSSNSDSSQGSAKWVLSGEEITLSFPSTVWTGIVEENEMSGTFAEKDCDGAWFLHR